MLGAALSIAGCATTAPREISPPPIPPAWIDAGEAPVLGTTPEGNFVVAPEMLQQAAQLRLYVERVQEWLRKEGLQ